LQNGIKGQINWQKSCSSNVGEIGVFKVVVIKFPGFDIIFFGEAKRMKQLCQSTADNEIFLKLEL
jgi:hypothetical protein